MTGNAVSIHAKVAARLMKKMGSALEAKPPGMRKTKTVEALTLKAPTAVRLQMQEETGGRP